MLGSINRMDGTNRDWSQARASGKATPDLSLNTNNVGIPNEKQAGNDGLSKEDKEKIYKEVEKLNHQLAVQNHSFRFKFSEEAEQFYMQIIDMKTQEVIESVPSEHMIELAAKLKDMIGFFIDKKL